jgi:CRISPR-associated DxTHG motif protein
MSKLKKFIEKHDKTIIMAIISLVPSLIIVLGFGPMLIESYTFNQVVNGQRSEYIDFSHGFRMIQLFAIAFMVLVTIYNFVRRSVVKDIMEKSGSCINIMSMTTSLCLLLFFCITTFALNSFYENKNNTFIENKLLSIKQSVLGGKCLPSPNKGIGYFTDVSSCGTVKGTLPGNVYLLKAGQYSTTSHKDGKSTTVTEEKPNILTYKNYLGSFCRDLTNSENPVYKEFAAVEVHGVNPLSDKFEKTSCEERKTIGQIQFMFK